MRILFPVILIIISGTIQSSAQTFEFDSINYKKMEVGVIVLKNNTWLIAVPHSNFTEYFMPVNLPEKYHVNNQDIVFEGALGRIPMENKPEGTPIRLSMIRILYKTEPRNGEAEHISGDNENALITDSIGFIQNQKGVIIKIGDTYLIEQNINGEIKRFVPDTFPEEFKKENAEIYFSCVLRKIPENVRMMGAPIILREIKFSE